MKKQAILQALLGVIGGAWLAAGVAQAAVASAVDANGTVIAGGPTVTILDASGTNPVADADFPKPGVTYTIIKTGSPSVTLTIPTTLSTSTWPGSSYPTGTSKWPGQCTNTGSHTDVSADFTNAGTNKWLSNDCGGTLVLTDGTNLYVVPQDTDKDGIPDWYERKYCTDGTATCINPTDDNELLGTNPAKGDAYAAFDEYRGFMVSGSLVRTSPTRKDIFVHLLDPQCTRQFSTLPTGYTSTSSFLGKSPSETGTRTIYPIDATQSVFQDLVNLGGSSTPVDLHFLNYLDRQTNGPATEWVDNVTSYDPNRTPDILYSSATGNVLDRVVNQNAVYPLGVPVIDPTTLQSRVVQKGIRVIECPDDRVNSPMGVAVFPGGVQEGNPDDETNSIIYTQRIYNDYANLLNKASSKGTVSAFQSCALAASTTCVFISTYQNGAWSAGTNKWPDPVSGPNSVNRDYITGKYIQYVVAMELGHSLELIPILQITQYGPHYAPGTGDNLDQRVVAKDSKTLGGILFQIPSVYGDKSNAGFILHP